MNEVATRSGDKRGMSALLWSPKTYDELKKFAEDISKSNMVPSAYKDKPGDIVVAMVRGAEIGFTPLASLDAFAIINGKACLYGDAPLALVQSSGLMEWHNEHNDGQTWTFEAKRKGDPHPIVSTFSLEDAKKAGLLGKAGPWTNYTKRMMMFRARGFGLRDKFSDALKGIGIAEEVEDYEVLGRVDEQTTIVRPIAGPKAAAVPATPAETVKEETQAPPAEAQREIITEPQRKRFFALWKGAGKTEEQVKAKLQEVNGSESSKDIPKAHYEALCKWAESK